MIKGIHHIGITVPNLDEVVAFYQRAVDLPCVHEAVVTLDDSAALTSSAKANSRQVRTVLLSGHTTYIELSQFVDSQSKARDPMPVYGPGITHICFQSPAADPAFEKFRRQGAAMHSRGDAPVKLSRRDIRYVYLRDNASNMFEVEEWDDPPKPFPIWIAHVALVSPDIERLTNFYSTILLGMDAPPEIRRINGIPNLDVVGNVDDADLYGTWIPTPNILLEIWQYVNPPTPDVSLQGSLAKPGYTHICFEVNELEQEIARLGAHDVPFLSKPFQTEDYKAIFGRDPDGNIFELREYLETAALSLNQLG